MESLPIWLLGFARSYLGYSFFNAAITVLLIGFFAAFRNIFVDHNGWHLRQIFVGTDLALALLCLGLGTFFFLIYRHLFTNLTANTAAILGGAAGSGLILFFVIYMPAMMTEKLAHHPTNQPTLILLIVNFIVGAIPLAGALVLYTEFLGRPL